MKDRLLMFMKEENLSSGRLAEKIGVQPSSISHILSGRNKPGYDFIANLSLKFPHLNIKWLLTGIGQMSDEISETGLEQNPILKDEYYPGELFQNDTEVKPLSLPIVDENKNNNKKEMDTPDLLQDNLPKKNNSEIEKILILYKDGTFDIYLK